MRTKSHFLIIPIILCIIYLTSSVVTYAKTSGITANPSSIFIHTGNNISTNQSIILFNNTGFEQKFTIQKKSFTVSNTGSIQIKELSKKEHNDLSNKIKILDGNNSVENILIKEYSSKAINIQLNTSDTISTYQAIFGLLINSTNNNSNLDYTKENIQAISDINTGVFIPIIITSNIGTDLKINIKRDLLSIQNPPLINIEFTNNTTYPLALNGEVKIKNIMGETVQNLYLTNKVILSGKDKINNKRSYKVNLENKLNTGIYKISITAEIYGSKENKNENKYILILKLKEISLGVLLSVFVVIAKIRLSKIRNTT